MGGRGLTLAGRRLARQAALPGIFINPTTTAPAYTLSLHDALPICPARGLVGGDVGSAATVPQGGVPAGEVASSVPDRKSTRLNSSHTVSSYAVFCLKKKTSSAP